MATLPPVTKLWTHARQVSEKPFIRRVCWRKDQLTLSYAFSKSILTITPFSFFRCSSWTVSWRMTTPSKIFLPCIKAVWVGRTTWSATELSLMVAAFVNILKLTLRRQIGLYCWIHTASLILGNKIISPKLSRNNSSWPAWKVPNSSKSSVLMTS